ncbi:hypothetical protein I593_01594 [Acinetobacter tandoii DSM 14970 = CIP 107469]|uniref:Uncharacterized protein n=2 Tax=Acinetobacter tandoii TaxID=202954 RepID=R9B181_9GAMM|nr:hypothetical protein I593_01594 [Acinetobacter tandoii DSM 14970 = CIP 107469]
MKLNSQLQKKMAKKKVCFLAITNMKSAFECNDYSSYHEFASDLFSPKNGRLKTYLNEQHSSISKMLNEKSFYTTVNQDINCKFGSFYSHIDQISRDFNYVIKIGFLHETHHDLNRSIGIGNPFKFHLNEPRWIFANDLNKAARDAIKLANEYRIDLEAIQDCDLPF